MAPFCVTTNLQRPPEGAGRPGHALTHRTRTVDRKHRGGSREPGCGLRGHSAQPCAQRTHTNATTRFPPDRLRGSCSRRSTYSRVYTSTRTPPYLRRPHPTDKTRDTIHQVDDKLYAVRYLNGNRLFVAHCTSLHPNALGGPSQGPRHRPDVASMSDVNANGERTCG
jgi:hypothetical protein